MVGALPARAAGADRITPAPTQLSAAVLQLLESDPQALGHFLGHLGAPLAIDKTDGLRMTLAQDRVLHLRPSGNAPEFRIYAEAATLADLQELLAYAKAAVATALDAQAQNIQTKGASK
jgi:phosphomannomutase